VVHGLSESSTDSRQGRSRARAALWFAASALWLVVISSGLFLLAAYKQSPGERQASPRHWPENNAIPLGTERATLVLFAHPRCPCTRATLGELEKIVARCPGAVTPWIVFFTPSGAGDEWRQTDQWDSAASIPGAHVLADPGGALASRFGALTSGQVLLYDTRGELVFSGGITAARGHAGDNAGADAVCAYLLHGARPGYETPVFGCSLLPKDSANKG
jgi:hypothetical protein